MDFFKTAVKAWEHVEGERMRVLKHRCLQVRNRNVDCHACVEACPSDCIVLNNNDVHLDSLLCSGCGACATACPTGALDPVDPGDLELSEACAHTLDLTGGIVVIGCRELVDPVADEVDAAKAIRVECLARVDESVLVELAAFGADRVMLACGDCETCALSPAERTAFSAVDAAEALLSAWNASLDIEIRTTLPSFVRKPKTAFGESRRAAFQSMKDTAVEAAASTVDAEVRSFMGEEEQEFQLSMLRSANGRNLPQFMPPRRERLLEALDYLGEPCDVIIDTPFWGHVELDAAVCDGCGLCEMFCPTGAIRVVEEDDVPVAVDMFPRRCLQCHTCEWVCLKKAIRIGSEVFARDIFAGTGERVMLETGRG